MTRDQLLASLLNVDRDAITFDDYNGGRYIDWSLEAFDGDGRSFDFGAGDGYDLSWDEIGRLQQALTLLVLEHGGW